MFKILSVCKGGGYRYCRTEPPHPSRNSKGLYPLHRVLLENKLGRLLLAKEEAHHINGDRTDDRSENVGLETKSSHASLHGKAKLRKPLVDLMCPECHVKFSKSGRDVRKGSRRNKSGLLFCSHCCAGKWGRRQF